MPPQETRNVLKLARGVEPPRLVLKNTTGPLRKFPSRIYRMLWIPVFGFRKNAPLKAWKSWQSLLRCWRKILRPATTTVHLLNRSTPTTLRCLLTGLRLVIGKAQIHINCLISKVIHVFTAPTSTSYHLAKVPGTTVTSLMIWSPAPSPTWPTHQAQQNTTRPFPLLGSCTTAPSLLEETMDWRKIGSIRRTRTGIWTALPSSGHSCRKRKASWVTSLMLYCWRPMDMAERKSGSRMSLYVCGNYTWP